MRKIRTFLTILKILRHCSHVEGFLTNIEATDSVVEAFIEGCNGKLHPNSVKDINPFDKGHWPTFNIQAWTKNPVVFFGAFRGTEIILQKALEKMHTFYSLDHAYFHRQSIFAFDRHAPGRYGRVYRCIKNQLQQNYLLNLEKRDRKRIQKYQRPSISPFKNGSHILLCPPSPSMCRVYGYDQKQWVNNTVQKLKEHTDREIIIRYKTETKKSLKEQLENCHALVSSQTGAAIEGVLSGVPSFCEYMSPCVPVSSTKLDTIESPFKPDIDLVNNWIDSLLASQFTIEEIRNGTCYEAVNRLQFKNITARENAVTSRQAAQAPY